MQVQPALNQPKSRGEKGNHGGEKYRMETIDAKVTKSAKRKTSTKLYEKTL